MWRCWKSGRSRSSWKIRTSKRSFRQTFKSSRNSMNLKCKSCRSSKWNWSKIWRLSRQFKSRLEVLMLLVLCASECPRRSERILRVVVLVVTRICKQVARLLYRMCSRNRIMRRWAQMWIRGRNGGKWSRLSNRIILLLGNSLNLLLLRLLLRSLP